MADPYPTHLGIEIDRPKLQTFLRAKWFSAWILLLGFFGVLFGLMAGMENATRRMNQESVPADPGVVLATVGVGLVAGLLAGTLLYFLFSHRAAARFSEGLRVSVEGPFLRIRQDLFIRTDRKLHFRSIVDYSVTQDLLMRWFQIQALQLSTTAGGTSATITIPAVKNCVEARDTLAEIDRLRENAV